MISSNFFSSLSKRRVDQKNSVNLKFGNDAPTDFRHFEILNNSHATQPSPGVVTRYLENGNSPIPILSKRKPLNFERHYGIIPFDEMLPSDIDKASVIS